MGSYADNHRSIWTQQVWRGGFVKRVFLIKRGFLNWNLDVAACFCVVRSRNEPVPYQFRHALISGGSWHPIPKPQNATHIKSKSIIPKRVAVIPRLLRFCAATNQLERLGAISLRDLVADRKEQNSRSTLPSNVRNYSGEFIDDAFSPFVICLMIPLYGAFKCSFEYCPFRLFVLINMFTAVKAELGAPELLFSLDNGVWGFRRISALVIHFRTPFRIASARGVSLKTPYVLSVVVCFLFTGSIIHLVLAAYPIINTPIILLASAPGDFDARGGYQTSDAFASRNRQL